MSFKLDFLGDRITNSELLIIGFLAIGLFAFATWKRSKVFYLISFLILASWLGNEVFKEIADRYPSMLKLSVPSGITELGNATNERLKIIADEVKNPKKIKKEEKKETYSLTLYGIVSEEVSLSPGTWKVSRDWKLAEYRLREWADYRPITEEIKISKKSDVFFRNKDKSGKSNVYSQIIVSN